MWRQLLGGVEFDILGGQAERFLNDCAAAGIPVQRVSAVPLGLRARTTLRGYRRMHLIARRRRCRLRMVKKQGAYFCARRLRRRQGLAVGMALALLILLLHTGLVWHVEFVDFTPAEEAQMRVLLGAKGVCEGARLTRRDLAQIQMQLFTENEAYSWVKLNFLEGRVVAEKTDRAPAPAAVPQDITDVVAVCDGIIEQIDASGGYLQKRTGQSVAAGEVLVSGMGTGPNGFIHPLHADAKVYARVERTYVFTQPLAAAVQAPGTVCGRSARVLCCGRWFLLGSSGGAAPDAVCTVTRAPLTLWGLPLPATLERTVWRAPQTVRQRLSPQQAQDTALAKLYAALAAELPGCRVRAAAVRAEQNGDAVTVHLQVTVRANIARMVPYPAPDAGVQQAKTAEND